MIEDGGLDAALSDRYRDWSSHEAQKVLSGGYRLEQIADYVEEAGLNPDPRSGRQEILENFVNRFV